MSDDEMSRSPKITIEAVSKHYGTATKQVIAVAAATFQIDPFEFVSIVGPSGCGKSTLLNIIAGLDSPTSGRVLIDNAAVADRRPFCGYMFQKDLLFPWRTVEANVALGLEVEGVGRRESRFRARAILERFGLASFASRYPSELSGGMRQRAALMRTLLCDRSILLLDEPFASLDALTRSIMQEWLLRIWSQERRTILFITHDIDEAIFLSDRVLLMSVRPGRIKSQFPVQLERPRDHRMTTSAVFTQLKQLIRDEIYEESIKADLASPMH
jgi:ABC-type nitrate/sulfonate/bicarbonate transport system ATPase subunit